ncbi:MAG TPA: hypothetical protein VKG26_16660 [Bacteroidia bacterium]|nr:hypothetical protein [Bacteroidia bacterium]
MGKEELDQLQKEWLFINASKELLSIVKNKQIIYADAIKFAKENAEELFANSKTGLASKSYLEKLHDKYIEESKGKSLQQKKKITPDELIEDRIREIELLFTFYPKDEVVVGLKKELKELKQILNRKKTTLLNLESITENQAILNDAYKTPPRQIFINSHLGKFNEYQDRDNGSTFRVTVLHPNPSEAIVGADLIYEKYDAERKYVRIVAIQYKIWENEVLYFSKASNLDEQCKKMKKCFCDIDLCLDEYGNNIAKDKYRFPYCTAFLKPTDKLQSPSNLYTTGYHIPICQIDGIKRDGYTASIIDIEGAKKVAIKARAFEELFNDDMVGSRWIKVKDLEDFYKDSKILEAKQKIILYGQNISGKIQK